jgi:hypothetical protein
MEIRSIPSTVQGPQGLDALGATAAPPPAPVETPSKALEPAVKIDIGNSGEKARFIRDVDSRAIVFQVVDTPTGAGGGAAVAPRASRPCGPCTVLGMLLISMSGSYDPVMAGLHHLHIKRLLIRACPAKLRCPVSESR